MWFRRKNKPSVRYADFQPTPHRAPRRPVAPVGSVKLDPIAPQAYDWLLNDAAWLRASIAESREKAAKLLADATEWEIVAASYERLAALHSPDRAAAPQPRLQPEPDLSRHNPTWQIPPRPDEPQAPPCGCDWPSGQSCQECDELVPARISILTPWSPTSEADAAGWKDSPTGQLPLVNGEVR